MEIREAKEADLDQLVEIWFAASSKAHAFIDVSYWEANKTLMRELYLPLSENWVVEGLAGFASLMGNELNALFITPDQQGMGYGKALVQWMQANREELFLDVYERNQRAVGFYAKMGFEVVERTPDEAVNEMQFRMHWKK